MVGKIEVNKIREILDLNYSYYDQIKIKYTCDDKLNLSIFDLLKKEIKKDFKVLDIGCGDGHTLLSLSKNFKEGVGIDNNKFHINLAKENKKKNKINNVSFKLCNSFNIPFTEEEFDFVFSERGPISGSSLNIQSAMRVLKNNGLLFEETIGELDNQEVNEVFHRGQQYRKYRNMKRVEEVKVLFERNGIDIRIINNLISKIIFPNIYEWLKYQCVVWSYNEVKLPTLEEINKIEDFFLTNKNDKGEVVITKHRIWIGGIKQINPPEYWEFKHFKK